MSPLFIHVELFPVYIFARVGRVTVHIKNKHKFPLLAKQIGRGLSLGPWWVAVYRGHT